MRGRARSVARQPGRFPGSRTLRAGCRGCRRGQADRRVPAGHPARCHPCAVLGPQRGDRRQRARGPLFRAREPRRLFPARAEHEPARCRQLHQPRHGQEAGDVGGAEGARGRGERGARQAGWRGAHRLLCQPQREGKGRPDRHPGRPRPRDRADHPGLVPTLQEQPPVRRRPWCGQDGDRGGLGATHRQRRRARGPEGCRHLCLGHGGTPGGDALSRRFRGAVEIGSGRARAKQACGALHRRDPHRDRGRGDQRRLARRVQHPQAGPGLGRTALHRFDDLQGVQELFREGPGAGAALPEDRRARALGGRIGQDPGWAAAELRAASPGALHPRCARGRGQTLDPLHPRSQAAGQGHRHHRRGRGGANVEADQLAQEDDQGARHRGDRRQDDAHPDEDRQRQGQGGAEDSRR